MNEDRYGLALTTASDEAAEAYRDGVDCILSAWTGADAAFDRAIAADPGFALAWIGRARVHHMLAEAAAAREKVATARALSARATPREQAHVAILGDAITGRSAEALAAALAHLEAWPRDALVMASPLGAFGLYAFSGRADHDRARVDLCERHARHYGEDWWFLTHRGWAHTEAGSLAIGQTYTEKALDLRWRNGNAAHALSHSLFERGATEAGVAFIDAWLPGYDRRAILNGHLTWHLALFALDRGDTATALRLYDERIGPKASLAPPLNTFTDASSLLWRIGLEAAAPRPGPPDHRGPPGHAPPDRREPPQPAAAPQWTGLPDRHAPPGRTGADRGSPPWRETAAFGERAFPAAGIAFADVHAALAGAACGACDALERRVAELRGLVAAGRLPPGGVVIELCRGFRAFAEGDYPAAADILGGAMGEVVRIGGSHAQREICEDTWLVALIRAGRRDEARRLLAARLERRPSARDERWLRAAA